MWGGPPGPPGGPPPPPPPGRPGLGAAASPAPTPPSAPGAPPPPPQVEDRSWSGQAEEGASRGPGGPPHSHKYFTGVILIDDHSGDLCADFSALVRGGLLPAAGRRGWPLSRLPVHDRADRPAHKPARRSRGRPCWRELAGALYECGPRLPFCCRAGLDTEPRG